MGQKDRKSRGTGSPLGLYLRTKERGPGRIPEVHLQLHSLFSLKPSVMVYFSLLLLFRLYSPLVFQERRHELINSWTNYLMAKGSLTHGVTWSG